MVAKEGPQERKGGQREGKRKGGREGYLLFLCLPVLPPYFSHSLAFASFTPCSFNWIVEKKYAELFTVPVPVF